MKKIGLIFPMKQELDETLKRMKKVKEYNIFDIKIIECESQENKCFLTISGIGKVNAARTTQILIDYMKVDYVINIGVAGSVAKGINKCDVVIASELVQHDYDITAFDHEKGYIPNIGISIKCDKDLIDITKKIKINQKIFWGTIASGDIFITDKNMGEKINRKFGALCVEMESAAIAQVCNLCKVPFLAIRSISDSPYEKDNNLTYVDFLEISSSVIADVLIQILEKI